MSTSHHLHRDAPLFVTSHQHVLILQLTVAKKKIATDAAPGSALPPLTKRYATIPTVSRCTVSPTFNILVCYYESTNTRHGVYHLEKVPRMHFRPRRIPCWKALCLHYDPQAVQINWRHESKSLQTVHRYPSRPPRYQTALVIRYLWTPYIYIHAKSIHTVAKSQIAVLTL